MKNKRCLPVSMALANVIVLFVSIPAAILLPGREGTPLEDHPTKAGCYFLES